MNELHKGDPIILFDGVCNLCNGFVKTLIKADKMAIFKFLPLQSPIAKKLLARTNLDPDLIDRLNTVVLITGNNGYAKSKAVLEVIRRLNYPWRLLIIAAVLPEKVLNILYDFIARNRYGWFGKKETCMIPSADIMDRFIKPE